MQALLSTVLPPGTVSVTSEELAEARRWFDAKFGGQPETVPFTGCLLPYVQSGKLRKNEAGKTGYSTYSLGSAPMKIADREYRRGLHVPSEGRVLVRLPGPAKRFEAVVGVDSNQVTGHPSNAGRGAAIASVEAAGKEVFRSPVMREGMPGVPVTVDLEGADEFALILADAGGGTVQGIDFNQLDWAEARVTLADGGTVWLGDLPVGPLAAPFANEVPFSFRYGGRPSGELLRLWDPARSERRIDEHRSELTLTWTDLSTGLQVRCVAVRYDDFPAVEWALSFRNAGSGPTLILDEIRSLDTRFERDREGEFLLHHSRGSPYGAPSAADYMPMETRLERPGELSLCAKAGMPAGGDLPFFNVEWSGKGVILAVGWPGQWAAKMTRDDGQELRIQAGQELAHYRLLPGEQTSAGMTAMLFWRGEWIRSQNLWRRWMIAHNIPRPKGWVPPPQLAVGSGSHTMEYAEANEENQLQFLNRFAEEGLKFDYYWIDAGWYPFPKGWWEMGTWEPDPARFPRGLRPISDAAHAHGAGLVVWFVPERVAPGTWLYENHPEWLVGANGQRKLVYFGNPEARNWFIAHVDRLIREQGIDVYRNDGGNWLPFWRARDAEDNEADTMVRRLDIWQAHGKADREVTDRQGITEIHHLDGFLAYWDELRRRHPDMLTDICGGGGSRNCLEFLRRAVPLHRSDYVFEPTGMQNLTYGMALWIPFFGAPTMAFDRYTFRSQMAPATSVGWDVRRKDLDYDFLRRMVGQWRQVADNYYGDFYPLTTYRTEDDVWMAWQFNRPEAGEGMIQVFRRPMSAIESMRFKLQGLDPAAWYSVMNLDAPDGAEMTGEQMMGRGLLVALEKQPDSALIVYKRFERPCP